jgi:hypothetical protein
MRTVDLFIRCAASSSVILLVAAQSAQELINAVLNPSPGSQHYSSYSSEIYINHTLYNQTPIASTNYDRLEASAKLLLPASAYDYAAGGAGLEKTVASNRAAFDKVRPSPGTAFRNISNNSNFPVANTSSGYAPRSTTSKSQHNPVQPYSTCACRHGTCWRANPLPPDR